LPPRWPRYARSGSPAPLERRLPSSGPSATCMTSPGSSTR